MEFINNIEELEKFNVYGLKQLCKYNRDYFNGYNIMRRDDLFKEIEKVIINDNIILKKPQFINKVCYKINKT